MQSYHKNTTYSLVASKISPFPCTHNSPSLNFNVFSFNVIQFPHSNNFIFLTCICYTKTVTKVWASRLSKRKYLYDHLICTYTSNENYEPPPPPPMPQSSTIHQSQPVPSTSHYSSPVNQPTFFMAHKKQRGAFILKKATDSFNYSITPWLQDQRHAPQLWTLNGIHPINDIQGLHSVNIKVDDRNRR